MRMRAGGLCTTMPFPPRTGGPPVGWLRLSTREAQMLAAPIRIGQDVDLVTVRVNYR